MHFVQSVQWQSVGGIRGRQTPCVTQHAKLGEGLEVGAEQRHTVEPGGNPQEGVLGVGGLEHEQHQGELPDVVPLGPAAGEVPAIVFQAGVNPFGGDGSSLELQQAVAIAVTQVEGEGSVGVDDVVGPVVAVADAGAGRGATGPGRRSPVSGLPRR